MAGRGSQKTQSQRWRIAVSGTVQGVGFRPFVYNLAHRHKIAGWVCNTPHGILIEAEGGAEDLRLFIQSVRSETPVLASISELRAESTQPTGDGGFLILASAGGAEVRPIIPPDAATCAECLSDVSTPGNRRHGYPFTNCTNCGPRFTIVRSIPYDRPNTTMRAFRMCPVCEAEYDDPLNRRFHAQPNACPDCGPHLSLDGKTLSGDSEVISEAARLLHEGAVLAVKGIGGYHLACDAGNTDAIWTLKTRKGRTGKPLALMCRDIEEARRICEVDSTCEELLHSPARPIVLMPARLQGGVSDLVARGTTSLGVMLPYTPLHHLLLQRSPPTLVMTSGNLSEEPIVHLDDEAIERLGHIADHILAHDRPIHNACDDSVARVHDGVSLVIRRARGYVPRPIEMDMEMPQVLACGGDLKSTFCLTKGRSAILSQHLGDLDNAPSLDHYVNVLDHFLRFFDVHPESIAHDLHPDYRATRHAMAIEGIPKVGVQHHHAHVASCMAENHLSGPVIGVAFDGTGYGTDGCIWGGEFLIADIESFSRAAHLAYMPIPGGEAAIRKPGRMALAYLLRALSDSMETVVAEIMPQLSADEICAVRTQIEHELNSPLTSSMGRLFDSVSALLGICSEVTYEGQAAIELEGIADGPVNSAYPHSVSKGLSGSLEIDVLPMIAGIVEEIRSGAPIGAISSKFHSTIADIVAETCTALREHTGLNQVALTGGVFQNMLLLSLARDRLKRRGFEVFRHSLVPCNDGGISLGQAVIAAGRSVR